MAVQNAYSAPGPALGVLAQINYALAMALSSRLPDDTEVSLETEDDFVFTPQRPEVLRELYQSKHHVGAATVGNKDRELWKSIRNWLDNYDPDEPIARYFLTTAVPQSGTAAKLLTKDCRNVADATKKLVDVAPSVSANGASEGATAFLALSPAEQENFVSSLHVVGGMPVGEEVLELIRIELRKSTTRERIDSLMYRLLGWWQAAVAAHLKAIGRHQNHAIRLMDINEEVVALGRELAVNSLPLDFGHLEEPTETEAAQKTDPFVQQLRWIHVRKDRLILAIHEHNQAYQQRSQWQAEGLVSLRALREYDQTVRIEWRHYFADLMDSEEMTEDEALRLARDLYRQMQTGALPEIVANMPRSYVSRGTLQLLADQGKIGWCRDWEHAFAQAFPDLWQDLQEAAA